MKMFVQSAMALKKQTSTGYIGNGTENTDATMGTSTQQCKPRVSGTQVS